MATNANDSDANVRNIIYRDVWDEFMRSPYREVAIDLAMNPLPHTHWQPANLQAFTPLTPPYSPPTGTQSLLIQNVSPASISQSVATSLVLPAASPPYSASPSLSPVSWSGNSELSSPAAVESELTATESHLSSLPQTVAAATTTLAHDTRPFEEYMDGGQISNSIAFPMFAHITHINRAWTGVFLHSWHIVFHATHTHQPVPSLIQIANRALHNAYTRWDAISSELLLPTSIVISNTHLNAIRRTNSTPAYQIGDVTNFESTFKGLIRMARQSNMNRLLRCTLGALVTSRVVPFIPEDRAYVNIQVQWSSLTTMIPPTYTAAQKEALLHSVTWNPLFGCQIWHLKEGNRILWFSNQPVRDFLALLLSPNEDATFALGVRHGRRDAQGYIVSWGPVSELDNTSVLALLAKLLASLSVCVLIDVVQQRPRLQSAMQDNSDVHRNSQINKLAEKTFQLLRVLDDLTFEHPEFQLDGNARIDGHRVLHGLKCVVLGVAS